MVDRYDEELFLEYVEGELPHEKRVAFENQMLQDPRLRNLVAQMVLDRHRLRTLPDEAPPPHLMDAVHERLERAMLLGAGPETFSPQSHTTLRVFRWRRFATLAAMAAMFAVVAGVFVVTLVTLSNDAPIRQTGPASLISPGLFGGTPTLQPIPKPPAQTTTSGAKDPQPTGATPTTTPAAATTSSPAIPATDPTTTARPAETARVVASPAVAPRPVAHRVMRITARDLSATQRRLEGWVLAYEAKVLDHREETPRVARPPAADSAITGQIGGANQSLQVVGGQSDTTPAGDTAGSQVVASLTFSLPAVMLSHLRTFVGNLPGTSVEEWVSPPMEVAQDAASPANPPTLPWKDASPHGTEPDTTGDTWMQALIASSPGLPDWLTGGRQSDAAPVTPPLRLEGEAGPSPSTQATSLPDPVIVRVEWVQR